MQTTSILDSKREKETNTGKIKIDMYFMVLTLKKIKTFNNWKWNNPICLTNVQDKHLAVNAKYFSVASLALTALYTFQIRWHKALYFCLKLESFTEFLIKAYT